MTSDQTPEEAVVAVAQLLETGNRNGHSFAHTVGVISSVPLIADALEARSRPKFKVGDIAYVFVGTRIDGGQVVETSHGDGDPALGSARVRWFSDGKEEWYQQAQLNRLARVEDLVGGTDDE